MTKNRANSNGVSAKTLYTLMVAKQILLNPAARFRNMERHGGFTEPLIFMASIGFIAGILKVLVTFYYMANGATISLLSALSALFIMPITVICFGYISAFLLSIIMRVLGCDNQVETAFRVVSYLCVVSPLAVILLPIPYFGTLLILGISTYLIVAAAIEVYQLNSNTAWRVFGLSLVGVAVLALSSEYVTRNSKTDSATVQPQVVSASTKTSSH